MGCEIFTITVMGITMICLHVISAKLEEKRKREADKRSIEEEQVI